MIAKTFSLAAQPHPCHGLFSSLPSGRRWFMSIRAKITGWKKVPSCKLSVYSITVRQASNGWDSSSPCSNNTSSSDKSPIAINHTTTADLQTLYIAIILFITACSLMHYLLTSSGSCHEICFCFMLCISSGSKSSFSWCSYSKQWFPCS